MEKSKSKVQDARGELLHGCPLVAGWTRTTHEGKNGRGNKYAIKRGIRNAIHGGGSLDEVDIEVEDSERRTRLATGWPSSSLLFRASPFGRLIRKITGFSLFFYPTALPRRNSAILVVFSN